MSESREIVRKRCVKQWA